LQSYKEHIQTNPAVIKAIKEKVKTKGSHETYADLNIEDDEEQCARNLKQVQNYKAADVRQNPDTAPSGNLAEQMKKVWNMVVDGKPLQVQRFHIDRKHGKGEVFLAKEENFLLARGQVTTRCRDPGVFSVDMTYNVGVNKLTTGVHELKTMYKAGT
jgi:hypothetical protein